MLHVLTASALSIGVIVGISLACALLLVVAVMASVALIRRKKHRDTQEPTGLPNPVVSYFGYGPEMDDAGMPDLGPGPPPLYSASDDSLASNSTATVTVSITYPRYEPPPSYDIAIVTRPRAPSYTPDSAPSYAESQRDLVNQHPDGRRRSRGRSKSEDRGQRSSVSSRGSVDMGDTSLTGHGAMGDYGVELNDANSIRRGSQSSQQSLSGQTMV